LTTRSAAEAGPRIRIESLAGHHVTRDFDCGVRLVNDYLRDALALQAAFLGRTFVAVEPGRAEVIGYYATHSHFITGGQTPGPVGRRLRRDAIVGTAYVVAFGVDRRHQGRRVGSRLFADALRRIRRIAAETGVHAVVLDAFDQRAEDFYRGFGFEPLAPPRRLFMRVADIP
jgi:GNAT superfamily N-acetyltransferase